jgi:hypothetical protein
MHVAALVNSFALVINFSFHQPGNRVADICRHDRNHTGTGDLRHAVYGYLEFALNHFIDFFLRIGMLAPAHEQPGPPASKARRMPPPHRPRWQH